MEEIPNDDQFELKLREACSTTLRVVASQAVTPSEASYHFPLYAALSSWFEVIPEYPVKALQNVIYHESEIPPVRRGPERRVDLKVSSDTISTMIEIKKFRDDHAMHRLVNDIGRLAICKSGYLVLFANSEEKKTCAKFLFQNKLITRNYERCNVPCDVIAQTFKLRRPLAVIADESEQARLVGVLKSISVCFLYAFQQMDGGACFVWHVTGDFDDDGFQWVIDGIPEGSLFGPDGEYCSADFWSKSDA